MKLLIIICSHEFNQTWFDNIEILKKYVNMLDMEVDYCGISNQNDFDNYNLSYRYKIINQKPQFSKLCDFITDCKPDYDWFMKFRPDLKLLEPLPFDTFKQNTINARARVYHGPKQIKYGMSVNGPGTWKNIGDCFYSNHEHSVVLDDQLFVFDKEVINMGTFEKTQRIEYENEWLQTRRFNMCRAPLNVIGINIEFCKYANLSGHVNMNYEM